LLARALIALLLSLPRRPEEAAQHTQLLRLLHPQGRCQKAMDELLAIITVRTAARKRFVDFVDNSNHLFAYKIDGPSAEGADGLTVRYQPSDLFADLLVAVRVGEGQLDDHGTSVMGALAAIAASDSILALREAEKRGVARASRCKPYTHAQNGAHAEEASPAGRRVSAPPTLRARNLFAPGELLGIQRRNTNGQTRSGIPDQQRQSPDFRHAS
jgi:hypothetical protein